MVTWVGGTECVLNGYLGPRHADDFGARNGDVSVWVLLLCCR